MSHIRVGISGWRYEGWRGVFYPEKLRHASELAFASHALQTIEINGTHYSLQSPKSFVQWRDETPDDFVFSVKGPRYLTHMLRFRGEKSMVATANFFAQGVFALGQKLGPILWQFPPSYKFDPEAFEAFLKMLPKNTEAALRLARQHDRRVKEPHLKIDRTRRLHHAVEIRHDSFCVPSFVRLLRKYGAALVISDSTEKWPHVEDVTSDFVYMRLHGTKSKYRGKYSDAALGRWEEHIQRWHAGEQPTDARLIAPEHAPPRRKSRDVYCYFDNDTKTQAPFDAQRLIRRIERLSEI